MSFWVDSYYGNMTFIDFSIWLLRTLNTTSSFVFVDVLAYRRSKFINKPNFVNINGLSFFLSYLG